MINKKEANYIYKKYINIILVVVFIIILLRIIETLFISFKFGLNSKIILLEFAGVFVDFSIAGFFLYLWYFVFRCFYKKYPKFTFNSFLIVIGVFNIFHLIILKYFLYQLRPLDIFLYEHSLRESLFSYKTSNTSYIDVILTSIFIITIVLVFYNFIRKKSISDKIATILSKVLLALFIIFPILEIFGVSQLNNFSNNKSYYFYKRSIGYFFKKEKKKFITFDVDILEKYQKVFNSKKYISLEYPLAHKFENKDVLGKFFNINDTVSPNLVFIITEGMSDEFIHNYKGIKLMPFIDSLSKNSLYWKNFFTLGERSFAVVPSITGGLPYGERGFTLLNRMPYHFSLINILKENGYYSIYFDSQDAWFHDKDKYFKFNNIDRIFDKENFSSKYKKILIGNENTFWGYNDKDFFNQALDVMDTLPVNKRVEIYFTGTMHSPFKIADKQKYIKLLEEKMSELEDQDTIDFFNTYRKQVLSIMFTNDAIRDFINNYKYRDEYDNTIFFITGDHPMTEIPPENQAKRYHVPFIIYSPNLNVAKTFPGISSHLDVYESLLSFLNNNYNVKIPEISSSVGYKLDTSSNKVNNKIFLFMNDNREIVDIYDRKLFLSNEKNLFKLIDDFNIKKIRNYSKKKKLESELNVFNTINDYIRIKRKLIPLADYFNFFGYELLYSFKDQNCESFNKEYHYIRKDVPLDNSELYIDISFDYKPDINEKTLIHYTFTNKEGKILYKNNYSIAYKLQEHRHIPQLNTGDSTIYLSVYFDNKAFKHIEYCNPEIKVYSSGNTENK